MRKAEHVKKRTVSKTVKMLVIEEKRIKRIKNQEADQTVQPNNAVEKMAVPQAAMQYSGKWEKHNLVTVMVLEQRSVGRDKILGSRGYQL